MSVIRGNWPGSEIGFEWIDSPGGKRRQQRPALAPEAMEGFQSWRRTMLQVTDFCRASAPRLAVGAAELLEEVVLPHRREVAGLMKKRTVVEHCVHHGWLVSEWGRARPSPDDPPDAEPEPSDRLYLLTDGRIVLRRAGANVQRPVRLVDDADFVQIVHRDNLTEQLRRRLVDLFREAELSPPIVPNRPSVDYADVWGKVARPGSSPTTGTPSST